jgi:hypothetical protein
MRGFGQLQIQGNYGIYYTTGGAGLAATRHSRKWLIASYSMKQIFCILGGTGRKPDAISFSIRHSLPAGFNDVLFSFRYAGNYRHYQLVAGSFWTQGISMYISVITSPFNVYQVAIIQEAADQQMTTTRSG